MRHERVCSWGKDEWSGVEWGFEGGRGGLEAVSRYPGGTLTGSRGRSIGTRYVPTPPHPPLPHPPPAQLPSSQGPDPSNWAPPREGLTPSGAGSWAPLFGLGHGLSYTTFALSGVAVAPASTPVDAAASVTVYVNVTNTGSVAGVDTVFVSSSVTIPGVMRYRRQISGFARIAVPTNGTVSASITVRQQDLGRWDPDAGVYVVDAGTYTLFVGDCLDSGFSDADWVDPCPAPMQSVTLTLTQPAEN